MSAEPSIGPARTDELASLPGIERAAGALFVGRGVPESVIAETTPLAEFAEAQREGRLLVARGAAGAPIGFALLDEVDGAAHLYEIDVLPEHGRRGVGRALVEAACRAAAEAGHRAMTLTTFRDVPWNGPFYARAGFRELAPAELGPGLAAMLRDEAARGLDPARRVAMRRELPGAPTNPKGGSG